MTPPEERSGAPAGFADFVGSRSPDMARRAVETVRHATEAMRAASSPAAASAIGYAAADLLTAAAQAWEGRSGGPLTEAADWFDRAVAVMGSLSRDRDTLAALHLIYSLAALADSLADLRETQHRLHQARAARHAAGQLRAWTPPAAAGPHPSPSVGVGVGVRRPAPHPMLGRRNRQR